MASHLGNRHRVVRARFVPAEGYDSRHAITFCRCLAASVEPLHRPIF